jgi:hypothetical protein
MINRLAKDQLISECHLKVSDDSTMTRPRHRVVTLIGSQFGWRPPNAPKNPDLPGPCTQLSARNGQAGRQNSRLLWTHPTGMVQSFGTQVLSAILAGRHTEMSTASILRLIRLEAKI